MAEVTGSGPVVLLVEDDRDSREMYELGLRLSGLDPRSVGSAAEAVALLTSLRPAVVVTDLTLPDRDGVEFCQRLERDAQTRDIPRIVLTGRSTDPAVDTVLVRACRRIIHKPCAPDELASAIAEVLRSNGGDTAEG